MAPQADPDLLERERYMKALRWRPNSDKRQDPAAEPPREPRSPQTRPQSQSTEPLPPSQSQERPGRDTAVIRRPLPEVPATTPSHDSVQRGFSPRRSHGALPAATPVAVTNNYVNGDMNIHQQDQHNYQSGQSSHNTVNGDVETAHRGTLRKFIAFLCRHWRFSICLLVPFLLPAANRKMCLNEGYRFVVRYIPVVDDVCAGLPSPLAAAEEVFPLPPPCRRPLPAVNSSHVSASVVAIAREISVLGDMDLADVVNGGVWQQVFADTHRIDRNLGRINEAFQTQQVSTHGALHRLSGRTRNEMARLEEPASGWYAWAPELLTALWTAGRDQAAILGLLDDLESLARDARTQRRALWDDIRASGLSVGDFDAVVGGLGNFEAAIAVEKKSLGVREADGDDPARVDKMRAAADSSEAGVSVVRKVMLDVSALQEAFVGSLEKEIEHVSELVEWTMPTLQRKAQEAYRKPEDLLHVLRHAKEEMESWLRAMPPWNCGNK